MACKEKYRKQNQNMSEKLNTGRNKCKKELFYLEVMGNIYLFIHLFIHSIFFEGFHIPDTGNSKPFTGGKKWDFVFTVLKVSWIILLFLPYSLSLSG